MVVDAQPGYERLIPANQHHGQQIRNHNHINQIQNDEHDGVFVRHTQIS